MVLNINAIIKDTKTQKIIMKRSIFGKMPWLGFELNFQTIMLLGNARIHAIPAQKNRAFHNSLEMGPSCSTGMAGTMSKLKWIKTKPSNRQILPQNSTTTMDHNMVLHWFLFFLI
jgi:hypothetical protein